MRILMVNASYGGVSGSGRAVKLLSEELLARGLKIDLFTDKTVGRLNIPKLKSISFTVLAKLREKRNYDIMHVHSPKFSEAVERHSNNVLTIHGDFLTEFQLSYGSLMSNLFDRWFSRQRRKFKAITCVSPYWSRLRGWVYIPNGLDLEKIKEIPPSDEHFVLFVGRKDRIKGYELFEEAAKETSYPYKMLGVHERAPWRQVISYMKSAHCLVLPTLQEGMPYSILEAFASGCPVIATDIPPLRSFGEGAILFLKKRDAKSIKKAITELVEDKTLQQSLRRKGLQKAKEYDIRKVTDQYISVYEEAVANP